MKLHPRLHKHEFNESSNESLFQCISLHDTHECNKLLAAKVCNMLWIGVISSKMSHFSHNLISLNIDFIVTGDQLSAYYVSNAKMIDFRPIQIKWSQPSIRFDYNIMFCFRTQFFRVLYRFEFCFNLIKI